MNLPCVLPWRTYFAMLADAPVDTIRVLGFTDVSVDGIVFTRGPLTDQERQLLLTDCDDRAVMYGALQNLAMAAAKDDE